MIGPEVIVDSFVRAFHVLSTQLYWLLGLILFVSVLRSAWFKGALGEWIVNVILQLSFKQPDYYLFKDVLLPTDKGTTQIDHILLSRYGIFVIETKNMKGWIFGKENQPKWTQQIYKHKFYFQNPTYQNFKHKRALESVLDLDGANVKSIVVFVGDAKFKTKMPTHVIHSSGLRRYIKTFTKERFSDTEMDGLKCQLSAGKLASSFKNKYEHVKYVKSLQSSHKQNNEIKTDVIDKMDAPVFTGKTRSCPKCGNDLVLRTAKKGDNKGNQFYGCSAFPKCRYIRS
jgi:restriction system protein